MKRIQLYSILGLAILITGAAVFWHSHSQKTTEPIVEATLATNEPSQNGYMPAPRSNVSAAQSGRIEAQTNFPTASPQIQKVMQAALAQSAENLAERSKPIAFYGKVVDEETQAVAGASVHFLWVDPTNTSEKDTTSAADGSFSLTDVVGGTVNVDVWKPDYYVVKSSKQFNFDNTGNGSTKDNPVLFHLRKKGSGIDLITSKYGFSPDLRVSAPLDGGAIHVDFLNRKVGAEGPLEISQRKPSYLQSKQATEWSFRMAISDGGLIEENEEFPFEAPDSGYQSTIDFNFNQGQTNWATDVHKDYYVKFGNPPHYGRLHLDTSIGMDGARLIYSVNPDGGRNLEPK